MHDAQIRTIDWETQGPRSQADVCRMTGYFWQKPDCSAFGAFTPSLGVGLYHVADPLQVPGMKLWSDGIGRDEAWVSQLHTGRDAMSGDSSRTARGSVRQGNARARPEA
jgi:hypothetical protein